MKYRILLFIIFILIASGLAAYFWQLNYGYVLLSNNAWRLETSLSRFLVLLIPCLLIAYVLVRILVFVLSLWPRFKQFSKTRHSDNAHKSTISGLMYLLEGRWQKAEKALVKDIEHNQSSLLNYLLAARAAQNAGDEDKRDEFLRAAHETTPEANIAIGITQADLQIAAQQNEMALATLESLRSSAPKHPYVIKQIGRLYAQLGEWHSFLDLLPEIRNKKVFNQDELVQLESKAYSSILKEKTKLKNLDELLNVWKSVPKELKKNTRFIEEYTGELKKLDQVGKKHAEKILRESINKNWMESLVRQYGLIDLEDPSDQLKVAEKWNTSHGRSPMLMLTLARLCYRLQLWGKSRVYYESSIALHPTATAYAELANLLDEKLEEKDKAVECMREGLNIATNTRWGKRVSDKDWGKRATDKLSVTAGPNSTKLIARQD